MLERQRPRCFVPREFPGAIKTPDQTSAGVLICRARITDAKAIDQMDLEPGLPQMTCKIEQTQRFGPEIKSGKIMDPGIDENQLGHNLQCTI
jgi:hypothetical protein